MPASPPARRRRRPDLRKLMFVLPNLFTVSSIVCGFYAIVAAAGPSTGDNFYRAALAIFFGSFFDGFDGRIARLTRTQSDFGVELDSLADVITFGVAPAVLVYKWALAPLGTLGFAIACIYCAAGAIRLARFNVLTHAEHEVDPKGVSRFFVGLPIPLAAGMLVSLVLALHGRLSPESVGPGPIAVLVLLLAFLMVSTIRYRTFKTARLGPGMLAAFAAVIGVGVFFALNGKLTQVFLVYFSFYILLGLIEELLFGRRRRAALAATAAAGAAATGGSGPLPIPETETEEALLPAEEDEDEDGVAGESAATAARRDEDDDEP